MDTVYNQSFPNKLLKKLEVIEEVVLSEISELDGLVMNKKIRRSI